jgi:dinuclear metal center YbgI/SA1388 family protein
MPTIQMIADFLESFAPAMLAEDWDNVGLLVGDATLPAERIMTCLTVTPKSVEEAVERKSQLIITHHPLPFHATKRLTAADITGRMLLRLIENRIAVYSPHTAFDSAAQGINQQLAEAMELRDVAPLVAIADAPPGTGAGRFGNREQAVPLAHLADQLKSFLQLDHLQLVGVPDAPIQRVAVACGAAGQFLPAAREAGCQLLLLGETNFHTCLEAQAYEIALLLTGHFSSERFALETLADRLQQQFPQATVWPSQTETDPISFL